MPNRTDVVRLAKSATRRVMKDQAGLFGAKKREIERLEQIKKMRAPKGRRSAGIRQLVEADGR